MFLLINLLLLLTFYNRKPPESHSIVKVISQKVYIFFVLLSQCKTFLITWTHSLIWIIARLSWIIPLLSSLHLQNISLKTSSTLYACPAGRYCYIIIIFFKYVFFKFETPSLAAIINASCQEKRFSQSK